MTQTLSILWPPSTNDLWRAVKGRNILSARYRAWKEAAGKDLMSQGPRSIKGPVEVSIWLSAPTKRAFDLDNRVKAILDLLVMMNIIESDDNRTVHKITVGQFESEWSGAKVSIVPIVEFTQVLPPCDVEAA